VESALDCVRLVLPYRPPIAWEALLAFLGARAAPATECVEGGVYARTIRIGDCAGVVRVTPPESAPSGSDAVLHVEVDASLAPQLDAVSERMRLLFNLDADPEAIASHLERNGFDPIRGEARGLRVPGAADGFELAIRAILGQQVSVKGASTLMSRVTAAFGDPFDSGHPLLSRLPVSAERLASAPPSAIAALGMPLARAATIHAVAVEAAGGRLRIAPTADVDSLTQRLLEIPGIGPWTAEYIVMRAANFHDAFPGSDLVLRRAAGNLTPTQLVRAAERWRPWRSYAAMHLWRRA
jgi:AraC family transcriptional regulator, regulatory protein of adaptative response / DNA-3-methyladenine glycosylase II